LTGMLSKPPIALREWMRHARPPAAYRNAAWPAGLRPPTPRSAGFLHHASQWTYLRRTDLALSSFAEACLRGHEAGLEGISVHGEVSGRALAGKLNYLAMRHWTYHPESTLEEFALAELAPRLGGEQAARAFAESLCLLEECGKEAEVLRLYKKHAAGYEPRNDRSGGDLAVWQLWEELAGWSYLREHCPSIAQGPLALV